MSVKDIYLELEQGNINPLEAYAKAKQLEAEHQEYFEKIQTEALEEAKKYEGKTFTAFNFAFEKRQGRKTFDFKHLQEWTLQKSKLAEVEEKYKIAWENSNKNVKSVTDEGEVLELPKVTYGKDVLVIKPLKQ